MLDETLRDLERALRESPRDRSLSARYLQALRRAGRIAPDALDQVEAVPNPGIRKGDLVLVARRSRPRAAFAWLEAMDARLGEVARVERLERDGLGVFLDGEPPVLPRWPGDPAVGRSFGFGSVLPLP